MRTEEEIYLMAAKFGVSYHQAVKDEAPDEALAMLGTAVAIFGWLMEVPDSYRSFRVIELAAEALVEPDKTKAAQNYLQGLLELGLENGEG